MRDIHKDMRVTRQPLYVGLERREFALKSCEANAQFRADVTSLFVVLKLGRPFYEKRQRRSAAKYCDQLVCLSLYLYVCMSSVCVCPLAYLKTACRSFVRSLRAGVQPTLDPSAETF